ncbi:MAG: alpha,alpha-trehalase TreA [Flavitalea sp.]
MRNLIFVSLIIMGLGLNAQPLSSPDKLYGELFVDVQMKQVFSDGKTFVDCIPKRDPAVILADYKIQKDTVDLKRFVLANFTVPGIVQSGYKSDSTKEVSLHIKELWNVLKRNADQTVSGSSLLPLPYSYIVPGGRFREVYYWDSYFTMLGLKQSGEAVTIDNMVKNFAYLINENGYIPNGNRTYYLSRSQPPYFSLMVELLAGIKGKAEYAIYLHALQKEYDYWMDKSKSTKHVVKMPDGSILNRYYDQSDQPRPESYREDALTIRASGKTKKVVARNLRSGAESGWDFSTRWFADGKNLATIETTNIIPVDLNCLLYHLETGLARAYKENGNLMKERLFNQHAERRKNAINKYLWSSSNGWYMDYHIGKKKQTSELTIAGMSPFFFSIAPENRMEPAVKLLKEKFLHVGGLTTTLKRSGQQWDAPNGWAPLQYIAILGLENYGQKDIARDIASRWMKLNISVYRRTGKLMEKYNVMDEGLEAGGGEYPSQDGFGWTNGVLMELMARYGD